MKTITDMVKNTVISFVLGVAMLLLWPLGICVLAHRKNEVVPAPLFITIFIGVIVIEIGWLFFVLDMYTRFIK